MTDKKQLNDILQKALNNPNRARKSAFGPKEWHLFIDTAIKRIEDSPDKNINFEFILKFFVLGITFFMFSLFIF